MYRRPSNRSRSEAGYTLIELVSASALTALVLTSTLALLRDAAGLSRAASDQDLMTTLCVSKIEEQLAAAAADFSPASASGDFASYNRPDLRYETLRSESPVDGGQPGALLAIAATVWRDADSDGVQDPDEEAVSFHTKLAKMAAYAELAPP